MLRVLGLVFYCSPKQHLGGGDGHGASWFQTSDMAHLGCLGDEELISAAGTSHQSLTPMRYGVPANVLRLSSGPLISCLFSGQANVVAPSGRR